MRIINKHVVSVALAALLCGAAGAQQTELKSGEVRASHLLGAVVKRLTGDPVGEVEDLIVSADADVRLAVISVGGVLGVGSKTVALPFDEFMIAPDGGTLFLTLSEEQLEAWPAFDLESIHTDSRSAAGEPVSPLGQTTFEADDFATADDSNHQDATPGEPHLEQQAAATQQAETEQHAAATQRAEIEQHAAAARQAEPDQQAAAAQQAEITQHAERAQPAETAPLSDIEQSQPADVEEQLAQAEQRALNEQPPEAQHSAQTDPLAQSEELAVAEQLAEESQHTQTPRDRAGSKSKAANQPASALIGAKVVDPQGAAIGSVNDVVVTAEPPEVQVIVELTETLGGGSRLVAVPLPELAIPQDSTDATPGHVSSVETSLTLAQLDALPQYQYQSQF